MLSGSAIDANEGRGVLLCKVFWICSESIGLIWVGKGDGQACKIEVDVKVEKFMYDGMATNLSCFTRFGKGHGSVVCVNDSMIRLAKHRWHSS